MLEGSGTTIAVSILAAALVLVEVKRLMHWRAVQNAKRANAAIANRCLGHLQTLATRDLVSHHLSTQISGSYYEALLALAKAGLLDTDTDGGVRLADLQQVGANAVHNVLEQQIAALSDRSERTWTLAKSAMANLLFSESIPGHPYPNLDYSIELVSRYMARITPPRPDPPAAA